MSRWFALALLTLALPVAAQGAPPTAGCDLGTAEAELDVAGVRASLHNVGGLFSRGGISTYEVPKGSLRNAIYSASLLVGGYVDGDLRFAGATYGRWEYWPGPLAPGGTTTPATCAAHDRIWVVGTADLAAYDATGTAAADLREWPVGIGAPFYVDADGDGRQDATEPTVSLDPGDVGYGTKTLDLAAGERPVVFGRQTAWWVMNDTGGPHEWSAGSGSFAIGPVDPLGIEVRVTAWARGGLGERDLFTSTFYRYEIVNRSTATIETAHAGLYVDADLGNHSDDRAGTDPAREMLFFYNGDELDENGYGDVPPAIGFDALSGAYAAPTPLKSSTWGEPGNAVQGYNTLRGLWRDGSEIRASGYGNEDQGEPTRWAFNGDVVARAFWSQENIDGVGTGAVPSDKRGILSSLPADLAPGERLVFDVAIVFAQEVSRLGSVVALRRVSDRAQALYDAGALTAAVADPAAPPTPTPLAPAEAAAVEGDAATFTWAPVADAEAYVLEVLPSADGEPLFRRTVFDATAEVPRTLFPLNRRAPLLWRVRAIRYGVEGEPSAPKSFTYFVPGFDRFSVVANAAGPLTPPVAFERHLAWDASAQTNGGRWAFVFEDELAGSAAAAAYPNDYEVRFVAAGTDPAYGVRVSDGERVTVPYELWDIGVGTPDDPSDDIRLVPVVRDVDASGNPLRERTFAWYRPERMVPGERGYRAWAEAAPLPDASRQVLPASSFESRFQTTSERPELGTVVRIESSAQALAVAAPEAPEALALEVRPNPTATRATVAYRLMAPGPVRLTLVDVLGREVAVLAEGDRPEGEHRVALDASRLAPGVYVVVLRSASEQATRTVTVAR